MEYELVVGLETHVELSTKTKIFCSCSAQFGASPNTHCCHVCIGLPGTLPKLNKAVVEYGVKAGLALNCKISEISKMARKNYIYPDLAKAYQISQHELPLCYDGFLELSNGKKIGITRIHIEEDAGKLIHENDAIYIDYNRGGVPLAEIVTEPDFSSVDEVKEYLEKLRLIMKYIGVSDCKMQEGSMRCDVNLSVRKKGETSFGTRTEIKNMNSISLISKAIDCEFKRQISCIQNNIPVVQETMRYNETTNATEPMRSKENLADYRYFTEPDLPDVCVNKAEIEKLKIQLPKLPEEKLQRYTKEYLLSEKEAMQIIKYPKVAQYFENMIFLSNAPKLCANVMLTHIYRHLEDDDAKEKCLLSVKADEIAKVLVMVSKNEIPNNAIKKIIDNMLTTGKSFDELFSKSDFAELDVNELNKIVENVIINNSKAVNDYLGGKTKAIASLIGLVMRETKGKANAGVVEEMLKNKINLTNEN